MTLFKAGGRLNAEVTGHPRLGAETLSRFRNLSFGNFARIVRARDVPWIPKRFINVSSLAGDVPGET